MPGLRRSATTGHGIARPVAAPPTGAAATRGSTRRGAGGRGGGQAGGRALGKAATKAAVPTPKPAAAARRSARTAQAADGASAADDADPFAFNEPSPKPQQARRGSRSRGAAEPAKAEGKAAPLDNNGKRKSQRLSGAHAEKGAKRAKKPAEPAGGDEDDEDAKAEAAAASVEEEQEEQEDEAAAKHGSDSDSDSDVDLATARPKPGAAVTVKRPGEKPPGSKRRKKAQWVAGKVKTIDERTKRMVIELEIGQDVKLKWDTKDVRYDNEEEDVQRPDLYAIDDRAIRLKDNLRAAIQIWQHSSKFRTFLRWVANVEKAKARASGASSSKAPSPPQSKKQAAAARPARKKLQQPGRTGLRNLGNTCYMSSVVQSLSAIPEFREIFVLLPEHMNGLTPAPAGSPSPTVAALSPGTALARTSTVMLVKDMQKGASGRRRASDASENLDAQAAARKKMLSWQLSDLLCAFLARLPRARLCLTPSRAARVSSQVFSCAIQFLPPLVCKPAMLSLRCCASLRVQTGAVVRENLDGDAAPVACGCLHTGPALRWIRTAGTQARHTLTGSVALLPDRSSCCDLLPSAFCLLPAVCGAGRARLSVLPAGACSRGAERGE
jgi:hypothetical protein